MEQNKEILRSYFETGDQPTQEQYHNTWDSFWHKEDVINEDKIEGLGASQKTIITTSGKITLKNDLSWVSNADGVYGYNLAFASDYTGSAENPTYEWQQLGHVIPLGYKICNVTIIGRSNSADVQDVRFQFVKRIKNTSGDWEGLNSDSQFTNTVLYDDLWIDNTEQGSHTGLIDRKAKRVFEMDTTNDNNLFNEDGEFLMYVKSLGSFTQDRFFQFSLTIELEKV